MSIRRAVAAGLPLAAALILPAAAAAAPPPNDAREHATPIASLPAHEAGTTAEATTEPFEPFSSCGEAGPSVWYSVRPGRTARIVVRLAAGGDLDAIVDVFRARRSKLDAIDCDAGDDTGHASLDFSATAGTRYLVRVAQLPASAAGTFRLGLSQAAPPARAPGRRLPRAGTQGHLDRVLHTSVAFSVRMRAGRTYRLNLVSRTRACLSLSLYGPGTVGDFGGFRPVRSRGCGGYFAFTPGAGRGGRYVLRVGADRGFRARQPFHLQVARAGRDDLAPGRSLRNHRTVRGRLTGGRIDVFDLYRFDVTHRSALNLDLRPRGRRASFDLMLLDDRGRRLRCACLRGRVGHGRIVTRLPAGRYFAAVHAFGAAHGRYALHRATRTITAATTTFAGQSSATALPGATVSVDVHVSPGADGPVRITLQRFDPVQGWQFFRRARRTAHAGLARLAFRPPARGRWRARADFLGTRDAAPSASGFAHLLVAGPLVE